MEEAKNLMTKEKIQIVFDKKDIEFEEKQVIEAMSLKKHGGLRWKDPNNDIFLLLASEESCCFMPCHGWSIVSNPVLV